MDNSKKEVWELTTPELTSLGNYLETRWVEDRRLYSSFQISPQARKDIFLPLGSKIWTTELGRDESILILKEFDISKYNIRSCRYSEAQEHLLSRNVAIAHYADLYEKGAQMPPLIGYQHGDDIYLTDGNRRFLAAKKAGVKKLQIFVETVDDNGKPKNRTDYIKEALDKDLPVPQEVLDEMKAGLWVPIQRRRTLFTYKEKRRNEYPSIGDQMDAIHKFLQGDTKELEAMWKKLKKVKGCYDKQ